MIDNTSRDTYLYPYVCVLIHPGTNIQKRYSLLLDQIVALINEYRFWMSKLVCTELCALLIVIKLRQGCLRSV
jgi:hypothetical protein